MSSLRYRTTIAVIIALLLAAWLRFYGIDQQSLWNDEGNSLGLARRSASDIVLAAAADIHPPGYYLALQNWHAVAGDSELALRALSALAGVLLVALVYRLGRQYFDRPAAAAAAFLAAFNPFLVYYGQEARMYALLAALGAASFLLFSVWLRSSRPPGPAWGRWTYGLAYSLVTAAGLYTHYAFGFVLVVQNLAALGGVLAHSRRITWPSRLAAWLGWQALAVAFFLPWLPIAYRQLTTWPAERAAQPLFASLADLGRYLAFGRTYPTAEAGLGLAGAAVLMLFGLRRRGQTITPLIWLVVPAGLTLGLGLLSEAFAKFLLVAVPALCLLLGHGLAAIPLSLGRGLEQRVREGARLALWLAAAGAFAVTTFASLNNLHFNTAYYRDDYRGIAQYVQRAGRPGDAVITIAPNQVEAYGHYHTASAPIYPLPHTRPLDPAETEAALRAIARQHPRIFVLFWGDAQADPEHFVENWLNAHAFKAGDQWYGQVRLATYAVSAPAAEPATRVEAVFQTRAGQAITLEGYSLQGKSLSPGDILQVTLFWRVDAPLPERYKVFVHLYTDADQPPLAQQDGEPGGGLAPTDTWEPGERVADNHGIYLPPDLPPGEYQLSVGLYDLFTGVRLPIVVDGAAIGDRLPLQTVTVK